MEISRFTDEADLARATADRIQELLSSKPDAVLVLPAGRTPIATYRELVHRAVADRSLVLDQAHLFQLDELVGVAPRDQRSFHSLLRRQLLDHLFDRDETRDHLLDGAASDPAAEIERQRRILEECGGADLVILGLGLNAHVGYNEPGSRADSPARIVELDVLTVDGVREAFRSGTVPVQGITLGIAEILEAKEVIVQVCGAAKEAILRSVLENEPGEDRPASLLLSHPNLHLLVDEAALPERPRTQEARG